MGVPIGDYFCMQLLIQAYSCLDVKRLRFLHECFKMSGVPEKMKLCAVSVYLYPVFCVKLGIIKIVAL